MSIKYWDCKPESKQAFEVGVLWVLEEDLTQVEKTPEPLSHPYTGARNPCERWDGVTYRYRSQAGP
jgi:hypothetical protein